MEKSNVVCPMQGAKKKKMRWNFSFVWHFILGPSFHSPKLKQLPFVAQPNESWNPAAAVAPRTHCRFCCKMRLIQQQNNALPVHRQHASAVTALQFKNSCIRRPPLLTRGNPRCCACLSAVETDDHKQKFPWNLAVCKGLVLLNLSFTRTDISAEFTHLSDESHVLKVTPLLT